MDRIKRLREKALKNVICYDEFFYKFYQYYDDYPQKDNSKRYAESFYYALTHITPSISEDELIVGKCDKQLSPSEKILWQEKYRLIAGQEFPWSEHAQDSHMTIDYRLVLEQGVNGILHTINCCLSNCNDEQRAFYQTCCRCLEAVIQFSENYADAAFRLSENTPDPLRRAELVKLSEICRKVPAEPAETFYEAVQSVHFITLCLSMNPLRYNWQQFQLGHPDRYLLPYYEKDIQSGAITGEYAQLLLDCLGIQINMRVPNGLSSGYMVGGRDENNRIVANELTLMCMQVVDDIKLVYPAVGLCYTEGMEDDYLEKACEILSHGRSHPAIFNDDIITKGLKCYGVPEREAHHYIHSTCVEITPATSSNVWVASPYTNMAQLLLDVMDREYGAFEELLSALFAKLDAKIKANFEEYNALRQMRAANSMNPLLSCFVNDCLKNGKDIEKGGARYNWIMPSFVGMANLVDSLYAVKTVVFDEKTLSIRELKAMLDHNFEGQEAFRLYLLNALPKYGNDIDEIDQYFTLITEHIISECKKYKGMHQGGSLIPSVFCYVMHVLFGDNTGATPDGRKAGFPLGDGSGPCQGRELAGPTASILSSTKWKHHELIGGVAVNMKFSKSSLGPNSVITMKQLLKTYLQRGGFEIQINVIDKETLKKAVDHPEEYSDLVVRIGGYSDYFVKLQPQMQQEIILRTEHEI